MVTDERLVGGEKSYSSRIDFLKQFWEDQLELDEKHFKNRPLQLRVNNLLRKIHMPSSLRKNLPKRIKRTKLLKISPQCKKTIEKGALYTSLAFSIPLTLLSSYGSLEKTGQGYVSR